MNFTVDDSDPSISYSSDGWAVQSQDDPDLDQFFQNTYHVAIQLGATMSFQFSGNAFTLYGSRGPGHALFQLQFDDTVVSLDASAQTTAFRQELFSHSFDTSGTSTEHLVKLTATQPGKWLDVDYITFTSGSGVTSSIGTATSAPPWLTDSSQSSFTVLTVPSSSASSPSSSKSSSSSFSSKVPTVLAGIFGATVALALLGVLAWLVFRRVHARRRERERAFRYGQSSVNRPSTATGPNPVNVASPSSAPPSASARSGGNAAGSPDAMMRERAATPLSAHGQRDGSGSMTSNAIEMRSTFSADRERERAAAATPSTMAGRTHASQSPIAWTTRKMGRDKGDADSMRTDFLQV